ncbi:MAG: universal stress protein [Proteobacteria bacterium]|nr:universal stress protein [Pseudomonadota bacterium]
MTLAPAPPTSVADPAVEQTASCLPKRFLVALDASDHANRALMEAIKLCGSVGGAITGIHVYAAKLHDRRFRQMEGGLPDRYREEKTLESQREIHDDLITRGLNIVSDSYHDHAGRVCAEAGLPYGRRSPEGKNYRRIVEAAESGEFDLIALGALGLGAAPGSAIGSVCERVARRSPIDVLVVREPDRAIGAGPIVVGLDGSPRSFGALRTALDIGRRLGAEVHAVAAFDPYYHYAAFNKIAGVLSDEASRLFRFKEQERLHEELIDDGLAKIYQAHLDVARTIAAEEGVALVCTLLTGRAYRAILEYLQRVGASLLVIGKTGTHADPGLDIGGNAENLLRMAPCHVWLGQVPYSPALDIVAEETIGWSKEAEAKMERVPETARKMVRMAILRFAQQRGHTVVTAALIDEATERFCPAGRGGSKAAGRMAHSEGVGDPAVAACAAPEPGWSAAALARLARVPEPVRPALRRRAEAAALEAGTAEITLEAMEAAIAEGRLAMKQTMRSGGHRSRRGGKERDHGAGG